MYEGSNLKKNWLQLLYGNKGLVKVFLQHLNHLPLLLCEDVERRFIVNLSHVGVYLQLFQHLALPLYHFSEDLDGRVHGLCLFVRDS